MHFLPMIVATDVEARSRWCQWLSGCESVGFSTVVGTLSANG
jgi:hypothetical protein